MKVPALALLLTAFCVGDLGACFISGSVDLPLPWLHLPSGAFHFETRPSALACDYYGRLLLGLVAGVVASGVAWPVVVRMNDEAVLRGLRLAIGWVIALVALSAAFQGFTLVGRPPAPLPLPEAHGAP